MVVAAAVCVAIAVLVLPGSIIAWVSGVRLPAAIAAGVPMTLGVAGLAAWLWGALHIEFTWLTTLLVWLVILALAAVWRFLIAARIRRRTPGSTRREALRLGRDRGSRFSWVLPGTGVVTGATLFISQQLSWLAETPGGMRNIFQGWDVQWHANAVRFILEEGVASPTRMGELQNIESHMTMLYPSAFHALTAVVAQVAGLDPISAVNLMGIVVPAVALPLTMASIVWVMVGHSGLVYQIGAGIAAIAIYASPVVDWIGLYVGAWPYLSAVALTGIVVAQFVGVVRAHHTALAAMLGFLGVVQTHPSSVTIVALAVGLYWLAHLLFAPVYGWARDYAWLVAPAVVGTLVYIPQLLTGSDQAEEVAEYTGDDASTRAASWVDALTMNTRHVDDFFADVDLTVVLVLAVVGAFFVVVWRRRVWVLALYVVALLLVVNALLTFDGVVGRALSAVGALHYNEAHRLILPVALLVFAAAGVGLAVLVRLLTLAPLSARSGSPRQVQVTGVLAVVVSLVVGAGTVWWVKDTIDRGAKESFQTPRVSGRMVDEDDIAAFEWLASRPEAYEGLTMGEPADGHSWAYAYSGVPTVARHYSWPRGGRGSDTYKLYGEAHMLGEGVRGAPDARNDIDRAAEELGVNFYMVSPWNFWSFQDVRWELIHGLWTADGTTPVYRKGSTVIFAVNAAFTPAEVAELQRDAQAKGSDPIVEPVVEPVAEPPVEPAVPAS